MAAAVLATAPPRFALAGISMGGYICFEIMRQAPERVIKLALLDTSARSDTPEQITQRRALVAQTRTGDFEARLAAAKLALPEDIRIWEHQKYLERPGLATSEAAGFRALRRWASGFYPEQHAAAEPVAHGV